jgi:dimeric dUTPase (all-alpha-NTP-PPase superfamily)
MNFLILKSNILKSITLEIMVNGLNYMNSLEIDCKLTNLRIKKKNNQINYVSNKLIF